MMARYIANSYADATLGQRLALSISQLTKELYDARTRLGYCTTVTCV